MLSAQLSTISFPELHINQNGVRVIPEIVGAGGPSGPCYLHNPASNKREVDRGYGEEHFINHGEFSQ